MMSAADKARQEISDELRDLALVAEDPDTEPWFMADALRALARRWEETQADAGWNVYQIEDYRQ